MLEPYLNRLGGNVDEDIATFDGGLNTYVDKGFLDSNQMPYVMNLTMKTPPSIQTRDSRNTIANKFGTKQIPWAEGEIVGMWAHRQDLIYFIIDHGDDDTLDLYIVKEGVATKLGTVARNSDRYYFCYCKTDTYEYVYIANENYKYRVNLGSINPLDLTTYTDLHYGIPCWHKNRLWLLKPRAGTLEWSNSLMPDSFIIGPDDPATPTYWGDSGEVPITNSRGSLTGMVSFDDKLIVFSEHSICAVYGNSGEDMIMSGETEIEYNPDYFTVVDLFGKIGCLYQYQIALGDNAVYWLGDDHQVYEYTGSTFYTISKPGKTRNSTISVGGIDNVIGLFKNPGIKLEATSDRLYIDTDEGYMFAFDIFNRVWWCEDGGFTTLANYSQTTNNLLMSTKRGDILSYDDTVAYGGHDEVYDWENNVITDKTIEFEFHTRVYGADGVNLRKTVSDVWLQMHNPTIVNCDVYINDVWCARDKWRDHFDNSIKSTTRYKKIGTVSTSSGAQTANLDRYDDMLYEQKRFIVEKMYGQRLNTFQIIVKGSGWAQFFIMKREWRAR